MKLAKPLAITTLCLLTFSTFFGCGTASKVKRTLALNDTHIQAAIAEENGDYQKAYELWLSYVDRRPQSVLAEHRLGIVEMKLGLYEQAISHFRVAHDLKPANLEYIEALADALVKANRTESLMTLLHETENEGPEGSGELRFAHYAQQVGLMDEAHQALVRAIALDNGQSPLPYIEMANFAQTIGDTESEVQNLRHALWFDQSNPAILTRLEGLGLISGPSLAVMPEVD